MLIYLLQTHSLFVFLIYIQIYRHFIDNEAAFAKLIDITLASEKSA